MLVPVRGGYDMRDIPWWASDPDYDPGIALVSNEKGWSFVVSPEIYDISFSVARMIDMLPEKAEKDLRSIIKKYPYVFAAYDMLAEILHNLEREEEAIDVLREGLWRAEDLFPSNFVLGKSSLSWSMQNNRPFLFMYRRLGEFLLRTDLDEAKYVLENLLRMDPWNDQITQDLVCRCYFSRQEYEAIVDFCNIFCGNLVTQTYCSILAFFKMGRIKEARSLLKVAIEEEKYIPAMLISGGPDKILDADLPEGEYDLVLACVFWDMFGDFWDEESRDFLRKEAKRNFYSSRAALQSYT